jgi:hypothetical protein
MRNSEYRTSAGVLGTQSADPRANTATRPWEYPYIPVRRPVDVPIREDSIRLGQFLKLADFAEPAQTPRN